MIGAGALFLVNNEFEDSDGFLSTGSMQFETDTNAIVFEPVNINLGEVAGNIAWRPSPSDFVTIKLVGSSNDPSKNIFIGIGRTLDVDSYLSGVGYDEVNRIRYFPLDVNYVGHSGDVVPEDPGSQTFWLGSESKSGVNSLEWAPEVGSYSVVLMNDDGSSGIDLGLSFGAKVPLLITIIMIMFAVGIFALIIGGLFIYFGKSISTQHQQEVAPPPQQVLENKGVTNFCSKCGSRITAEDAFCQNCGQKQ